MTITVTQEDIDDGTKRSCHSCPVACAIARLKNNWNWHVHNDAVYSVTECKYVGDLPQEAIDFIKLFDSGHKRLVSPFTFELLLR